MDTITEYDTPYGTVRTVFRITPELQNEGVPRPRDGVPDQGARRTTTRSTTCVEHTKVVPTHEEYAAYERAVGEDGLAFPQAGSCPIHKIQREYTGYQQSYFELADNLPQVERLAEMLQAQFDEITGDLRRLGRARRSRPTATTTSRSTRRRSSSGGSASR